MAKTKPSSSARSAVLFTALIADVAAVRVATALTALLTGNLTRTKGTMN
jgi:hypothetical protein